MITRALNELELTVGSLAMLRHYLKLAYEAVTQETLNDKLVQRGTIAQGAKVDWLRITMVLARPVLPLHAKNRLLEMLTELYLPLCGFGHMGGNVRELAPFAAHILTLSTPCKDASKVEPLSPPSGNKHILKIKPPIIENVREGIFCLHHWSTHPLG
jgi:hypothetical protein